MSHWEYYGEDQHKPDLKIILEDILKNTTDSRVYKRFEVILEEIERLEEKIEDLESAIESRRDTLNEICIDRDNYKEKYENLYKSIEETLRSN